MASRVLCAAGRSFLSGTSFEVGFDGFFHIEAIRSGSQAHGDEFRRVAEQAVLLFDATASRVTVQTGHSASVGCEVLHGFGAAHAPYPLARASSASRRRIS